MIWIKIHRYFYCNWYDSIISSNKLIKNQIKRCYLLKLRIITNSRCALADGNLKHKMFVAANAELMKLSTVIQTIFGWCPIFNFCFVSNMHSRQGIQLQTVWWTTCEVDLCIEMIYLVS